MREVRVETGRALESIEVLMHDLLAEEVKIEIILVVACGRDRLVMLDITSS